MVDFWEFATEFAALIVPLLVAGRLSVTIVEALKGVFGAILDGNNAQRLAAAIVAGILGPVAYIATGALVDGFPTGPVELFRAAGEVWLLATAFYHWFIKGGDPPSTV